MPILEDVNRNYIALDGEGPPQLVGIYGIREIVKGNGDRRPALPCLPNPTRDIFGHLGPETSWHDDC